MYPATNRLLLLLMLTGMIALVTTASGLTISPICTAGNIQSFSAIDGDHVVWQDGRSYINYPDIYMYDLTTKEETAICIKPYTTQVRPRISGNRIVWMDYRNGAPDIYLYNLTTDTEHVICNAPDNQENPDIYGDYVVWADKRSGDYDIYLYNLTTDTEHVICDATNDQKYPAISGEYVVWEDKRNGNYDIYLYNLTTGTEIVICDNATGNQAAPRISGDYIVWMDYRDYHLSAGIYLYNLTTGTETVICNGAYTEDYPDIDGNRVVWMDYRSSLDNSDIYMYDFDTGIVTAICTATGNQEYPAISGNRIVYTNGTDIYMADLSETPPVAEVGPDQTVLVGIDVNFDGSWSSDSDGTIDLYSWVFGDGSSDTGMTVTHAYTVPGIYTVTLTVTDDDGQTGSDTATVTVKTPGEATEDLITQVEDLGLPRGTEGALTAKLDAAIAALDRGNEKAAINNLNLFISQVEAQRGKKLDIEDANALIAEAQKIIAAI